MKTIFLGCLLAVAAVAAKAQNATNSSAQHVRIYQVCYDPSLCTLTSIGNHINLFPTMTLPLPTPITPCGAGEETGYRLLFPDGCGNTDIGSFSGPTCGAFPPSTSVTNPGCFSPATVPIIYDPLTGDLLIN